MYVKVELKYGRAPATFHQLVRVLQWKLAHVTGSLVQSTGIGQRGRVGQRVVKRAGMRALRGLGPAINLIHDMAVCTV